MGLRYPTPMKAPEVKRLHLNFYKSVPKQRCPPNWESPSPTRGVLLLPRFPEGCMRGWPQPRSGREQVHGSARPARCRGGGRSERRPGARRSRPGAGRPRGTAAPAAATSCSASPRPLRPAGRQARSPQPTGAARGREKKRGGGKKKKESLYVRRRRQEDSLRRRAAAGEQRRPGEAGERRRGRAVPWGTEGGRCAGPGAACAAAGGRGRAGGCG